MTTLKLNHPDISTMPTTGISVDYASGTTLIVKDTSAFAANDYLILDALSSGQCEIVQIASVTDSTTLVLVAGGNFAHASDATVTKIPYNQFRVYRSVTGLGGTYSLLFAGALQADQSQNTYIDVNSQSPYSYQMSYYNSTTTIESSLSNEYPFAGLSDYSLSAMQDMVLSMFGDKQEKNIDREKIRYWFNECLRKVQLFITGGESPYFALYTDITSTGASSYELSSYKIIRIFNTQLSYDNGLTFDDVVSPEDARFNVLPGGTTAYSYKLIGTQMRFSETNPIPTGYIIRIWYYTQPATLVNQTDELPWPLPIIVDLFINWALRRAHEKDRKFQENAAYYQALIKAEFENPDSFLMRLKSRIKQGNMKQASTWMDDFSQPY